MQDVPTDPENALTYWIDRLASCEIGDEEWQEAVSAIQEFGLVVIPSLIDVIADERLSVRVGIGNVLADLGPDVVYGLIGALKHEDPFVRQHAAQLLYGSATREEPLVTDAVPALIEALKDSDCLVRQWAVVALERIGPQAEEAVGGLVEVLDDPDHEVRRWAAVALGNIGQAARSAIPALTKLLLDDVSDVREAASQSMDRIQGTEEPPPI